MSIRGPLGLPHSHRSGAFSSRSPRMRERCGVVIPATNSFENIASAASGSPSCARPELVKARLSARSSGRASELVIAPARVAQPAPGSGRVLDPEQQEGGRSQVAVAAGEQALDVGEIERHSDCTHLDASPPRRPARMRSFCWMLSAVSRS